jgi:hypothetical protein
VARKQIELATSGLRQIAVKLWKFFFATCGLRQITVKLWKTRIRKAISAIPTDMLHRTWQELEYRMDALRATKGVYIEVYLGQ